MTLMWEETIFDKAVNKSALKSDMWTDRWRMKSQPCKDLAEAHSKQNEVQKQRAYIRSKAGPITKKTHY